MLLSVYEPKSPDSSDSINSATKSFKERLWRIIFEAETPSGKFFDVALLWVISLIVLAVMLESVYAIALEYHKLLIAAEWAFTVIFTI